VALVVALVVAACTPADDDASDITVFAAASLRDVFSDLERAWEAEHAGADMTVAYDGSNVLAAQIAEGAPADVFASADLMRPTALLESGSAVGSVVPFARNGIALVVPNDNDRVGSPDDLGEAGVSIVAAGRGVPITSYADEALRQLAQTMAEPAAFVDAVTANVVSREDNVRAALAKVELGEGDAAFVYQTDASSSEDVREVPLPAAVSVSAEYGAVQVSDRAAAADFLEWLTGPAATGILADAGFEMPS
jgi:molybdate transport system substrate-binding protein